MDRGPDGIGRTLILLYPALFLLGILLAYLVLSLMAGRPLFVRVKPQFGEESISGWFRRGGRKRPGGDALKACPICGSHLKKGRFIKSVAYPVGAKAGNVSERLSHIFGCPFCYPPNNTTPRVCPVCRQIVPADGYLIARMFERPDRERKHVHVLGCTACRRG